MASALINRVLFRAASSGTGSFVVSSAITGYMTPATGGAVNATVYSYAAESDDRTEWEIGTGTYTTGDVTLTRTPLKSSNADAAVSFTAAPKVALTGLAADFLVPADIANMVETSDIGVSVQAYDAQLDTWSGVTPSANGQSLVAAADYAAMRGLLDLEAGTDFYSIAAADAAFQAIDPQLSSLIRQNSKSAAYTLVLTDGGKHIYHPAADTTARIWTIPANATVAFPIGTVVTFDNDIGAGAITIAITSDTLVLVGAGTTGSRTLASGGQATAIKVTSTRWRISGTGLT